MVLTFSVPSAISIIAGFFLLPIIPYVWGYRRENPSAAAYTYLLSAVALWAFSYGFALMVFDPKLRRLLDIPVWTARILVVYMILVTGFKYSGYDRSLPRWAKAVIVLAFAFSWLLQVTNVLGYHTLMWDSYTVQSVLGGAAVQFEPTVPTYLLVIMAYISVGIAYLLALEAVLSYGPLYRFHAVAIVLWSLPPLLANFVWLINLGTPMGIELPLSGLDLTPPSLLLTALTLGYILFAREGELLEIVPANRRLAETVAEDNIDTGIVMVNRDSLVLGMNQPAADIFGIDKTEALTEPLHEVVGVSVALPVDEPTTVTFPDDPSRTYQISTSKIQQDSPDGDRGEELGYTVNIQDITKQRRRQQRLEVLNRVLRHNLRNDMVVINGNAQQISELVEDPEDGISENLAQTISEKTEHIEGKSQELVRISEKARDISEALPEDMPDRHPVDVSELVSSVLKDIRTNHPEADITLSAPEDHRIPTDERLLTVVLENLVENAVVHSHNEKPNVSVSVSPPGSGDGHRDRDTAGDREGATRITVTDDGPGIPEHEIEVIERGYEGSIEHGSGMGLWIVSWGVRDLGGTVEFEVDDGTTATVTLPELSPDEDG